MKQQKCLSICIVGRPNAGKSSLLNRLIGQKISIVTPKVQTTRSIITGIVTLKNTQLILFDTPGIFEPKKKLEKAMVRCAWSSLSGADKVALIIDSSKPIDNSILDIIKKLSSLKVDLIFLLNKIDLEAKELELNRQFLTINFPKYQVFELSATTGQGIEEFCNYLDLEAQIKPWLYEEDDITNLPMRFLASEITREQLFLNLHEELPYNLTVQTETWEELKDKSVKIHQVIVVSRESYKTIILGKHGTKIKEIGFKARKEIESLLGFKIHLFLFVKVRGSWDDTPEFYHYMGLKFEKDK